LLHLQQSVVAEVEQVTATQLTRQTLVEELLRIVADLEVVVQDGFSLQAQ
jgi:hypothetical protein